jgi:magnesium and cobalt exporter, CNNM family
MTKYATEILVLFVLIAVNGVFALAELAIVSARRPRLEAKARQGSKGAAAALKLLDKPSRFLSTVQLGITLIGTLAGAIGGATLAKDLAEQFRRVPLLADDAEPLGIAAVVVSMTLCIIVLGELVPKRLALSRPETIAIFVARPLHWLSVIAAPIVNLLSFVTDLVLRTIPDHSEPDPSVSSEDVKHLVDEGTRAGVFESSEQEMIHRVFRLSERRAGSLMTPRNSIVWIDVGDSPEEVKKKIGESPHSSFPVCDGSIDNIIGVVRVKDLLLHGFAERRLELKGLLAMPLFLFEGAKGPKILETFRTSGQHFALVLDEYGSVQGVLTLNDILEAIVGEFNGPEENPESRAVRREDGSWLLDGTLPLDEFEHLPGCPELPRGDYHTLAGFLIAQVGRIPRVGELLDWDGCRFEVVDMDGNRVDRVLVGPITKTT